MKCDWRGEEGCESGGFKRDVQEKNGILLTLINMQERTKDEMPFCSCLIIFEHIGRIVGSAYLFFCLSLVSFLLAAFQTGFHPFKTGSSSFSGIFSVKKERNWARFPHWLKTFGDYVARNVFSHFLSFLLPQARNICQVFNHVKNNTPPSFDVITLSISNSLLKSGLRSAEHAGRRQRCLYFNTTAQSSSAPTKKKFPSPLNKRNMQGIRL